MQLFHVMNLEIALVQNLCKYIVEDSAVPKQRLVTPFIMEQNATHVLVSMSCEIVFLCYCCLVYRTIPFLLCSPNSIPQHDPCTCVFCPHLKSIRIHLDPGQLLRLRVMQERIILTTSCMFAGSGMCR